MEKNFKELYERLRESYSELAMENLALKRKLGGYKSSNEQYRKTIQRCNKAIDDAMVNSQTARDNIIKMQSAYNGMIEEVNDLRDMLRDAQRRYERIFERPWYKRIFLKKDD